MAANGQSGRKPIYLKTNVVARRINRLLRRRNFDLAKKLLIQYRLLTLDLYRLIEPQYQEIVKNWLPLGAIPIESVHVGPPSSTRPVDRNQVVRDFVRTSRTLFRRPFSREAYEQEKQDFFLRKREMEPPSDEVVAKVMLETVRQRAQPPTLEEVTDFIDTPVLREGLQPTRQDSHADLLVLGPLCRDWYLALPAGEVKIKVEGMIRALLERRDSGFHVPRSQWPKAPAYHGLNNLFKYKLDKEMRATYTILRRYVWIVYVIEIWEHGEYSDYAMRFGY